MIPMRQRILGESPYLTVPVPFTITIVKVDFEFHLFKLMPEAQYSAAVAAAHSSKMGERMQLKA